MTLHKRTTTTLRSARRTVAATLTASLLLGAMTLTLPTPHVHAEEAQNAAPGVTIDQTDTILDSGALDTESSGETGGSDAADGAGDAGQDAAGTPDGGETDAEAAGVTDGETDASEAAEASGEEAATADDGSGLVRANLSATPEWNTTSYLNRYQAPVTRYEASTPGFNGNYAIGKAFDNNWSTMYSALNAGETTITMDFGQVEDLNRFLFKSHDSGAQDGYPTKFSIRASLTGEPDSYTDVVTEYESEASGQQLSFSFAEHFQAKSVQLVIHTAYKDDKARVAEIKWLRYDAIEEEVNSLFADSARTQLSEAWQSEEKLADLQRRVEKHAYADTMLGYVERARMILNGTWTLNTKFTRTTIKAGEGYDSEAYLKQYQTAVDVDGSSTNNPGQSGKELAKAFDGDWNTRYLSTKAVATTVTMKLTGETKIHRILYSTGMDSAYGYPTTLKIGFSDTGHEGSFREVSAAAGATNDKVMFTLSEPVTATYVRFSFDGIHGGFNGFRYGASEIKVLSFDQVAYDVNDLFKDADTQYTLKDRYDNEEWLTDLQQRVDKHPYKESFAKAMARAWAVYRGQLKTEENNDRLDWPVHVIQKTGDDSERIVYVMLAEGYRADEMDKFKSDVTERIQDMLDLEPYRSMAPYMNIYAYCAESNESGYSSPTKTRDTFFKAYFRDSGVNGGVNQNRANLARNWIQNNYLDKGGKIMHATALINTEVYFGQGNGTSSASLSAGFKMTAHEGAHMYATLVDHYTFDNIIRADNGGTNQTVNGDWKTIRWHEFLGHRGTGIHGSNGKFNPTTNCLMDNYYTDRFCEVCRESIFRYLNNQLKIKNPMYVAQPEITIKRTDEEIAKGTGTGVAATDNAGSAAEWQSGPVVGESNITKANGRRLQYRTVVSNYLDTDQEIVLSFRITGADGTVKTEKEQTFSVHPNTVQSFEGLYPTIGSKPVSTTSDIRMAGAMSLTLVTDELTGLEEGDVIDAKVTYNGQLMGTDSRISYGTAKIDYKLVDENGNEIGDMEEMGEQQLRVLTGTNTLPDVPEIYGYTFVKSNIDEDAWRAEEGKTTEIVRYYRQTSVQVTRVLVDANGLEVSRKSERVASGTVVTPAKGDFTVSEGYVVEAPQAVTVGSEDMTLTYTVRKGSDVTNATLKKSVTAYKWDGGEPMLNKDRPLSQAVDGNKSSTDNYGEWTDGSDAKKRSYMEVDLDGLYELAGQDASDPLKDAIRMWRYWGDGRTYFGTVIVASEKGTFKEGDYTVLYNSDKNNVFGFGNGSDATYKETKDGMTASLPSKGIKANRIRVYAMGRQGNASNHVVEFEVYGRKVDMAYNTELEQAIEALSKKVESGLYTEQSAVAARAAIERARRKLISGADDEATATLKTQLADAERKLRAKSQSEGRVEFLGGSLRYSTEVASSLDGLRLGFRFIVPKGAKVDWSRTGWDYGRTAGVAAGFQPVMKYLSQDGGYVANLVVTDIPVDQYDRILYARARLTYTLDGEEHEVVSSTANSRSVNGVAGKIVGSKLAGTRERELAEAILRM